MRALSSMIALAAAGIVAVTGTAAHADSVNLRARVMPGQEVMLTPELVPTAAYRGNVLVKLENNDVPTEVRVANCRGRSIGKVEIAPNDHAPRVAATLSRRAVRSLARTDRDDAVQSGPAQTDDTQGATQTDTQGASRTASRDVQANTRARLAQSCLRFKVKNLGQTPAVIKGIGYF
ncbi:hypothetical protein ACFYSC_02150 [Streptosporangium sp. NPDC004379]|uniref:hypothetical protein n=1 Tax=Streptosporangium sp. NPDC004379 TaxID=3366189 RepID=UPI00369BBE27